MKALLCREYGPPEKLVLAEIDEPSPGAGEVVIDVHAAAVNFPDTLIIRNLYQFKPELPFVPGGECAGVVKAVGEGVHNCRAGDRVIAFTGWGAFAEQAKCQAAQVVPLVPAMDAVTGAAFVMTYATSLHALQDRAGLREGETLCVLGASGGVGLAAVEIGRNLGAKVIACASTDQKLAVCRDHGAHETINYETEDLKARIRELTDGQGADVIYDPVGGKYSEPALRAIAWRGRHLVIGFANGEIPKIPLNLPLLKGASITGVFWGDFAKREPRNLGTDLQTLLGWFQAGRLKPHVAATYPLERGGEAIRALMDRTVSGKVVVTMTPQPE
ncbi:MAG: NADPH:quinone oxidoreductase family protein [Xanthomonadales bacterium]|nr:NADPH:quinone oxidoreductase family protein [Xanthomonadales bacterium]